MSKRKLGVLGASLLLAASGAATHVTAQAATTASSTAQAGVVAVSIDSSRNITMPSTLQPGVNTFSIKVQKPGSFQLVRLAEGYTLEQANADIVKGLDKGDPEAQKNFEANSTLEGGASVFPGRTNKLAVHLPAGASYVALDVFGKTYKYKTFSVAGADTGASLPKGKKIKAIKDVSLAKQPRAIPRKGWLTFKNAASQNHHLLIVGLKPGKTYKKDFVAWANGGFQGQPPLSFRNSMELGVVDPGESETVKYKLAKGNYVALCFWPDPNMKGMPHAMMGMHRALTVK